VPLTPPIIDKDRPRWLFWALILCFAVGMLRVLPLLLHSPLIALANSYDEVRYSACLDLYPDRPADVAPTLNSPAAPYSRYMFRETSEPICYWSTEWIFQATAAGIFKIESALTGETFFSVRWLGALKFITCFVVWILFCVAWWRRGPPALALAGAASPARLRNGSV